MFVLTPQLVGELAGMTDPWDIEKHLNDTFPRVFTDAAKMNDADLERVMNQS